jgi:beta-mannanase
MDELNNIFQLLLIGWVIVGLFCLTGSVASGPIKDQGDRNERTTRRRLMKTLLTAALAIPFLGEAAVLASPAINLGAYDPSGLLEHEPGVKIEHVFVNWTNYRSGDLLRQLQAIRNKGRRPLVSIEPWGDTAITPLSSYLLADVITGKYDRMIRALASDIAEFRDPVYVRWGHEMENVTGRYPWAVRNAELYKNAYRHFVTTCRLYARNTYYIWSPVGDHGCERYWPGLAFVDFVGLSVFEFPQFDLRYYHKVRSFSEQMSEKYRRIAAFQKPVIIAEFGVTGDHDFQQAWLRAALQDMRNYPLLKAVAYFQAKDTPGAWGAHYTTPDWRISPQFLASRR